MEFREHISTPPPLRKRGEESVQIRRFVVEVLLGRPNVLTGFAAFPLDQVL